MAGFVLAAAAVVVVVVVAAAVAAVADLLNCRLSQTEAYQDTESRLDGEGWRVKTQ